MRLLLVAVLLRIVTMSRGGVASLVLHFESLAGNEEAVHALDSQVCTLFVRITHEAVAFGETCVQIHYHLDRQDVAESHEEAVKGVVINRAGQMKDEQIAAAVLRAVGRGRAVGHHRPFLRGHEVQLRESA